MLRRPACVPRLDLRHLPMQEEEVAPSRWRGRPSSSMPMLLSPVGPRLRRHRFAFGEIITTPRSKPNAAESPAGGRAEPHDGRNDNTLFLAENAFRRYHYDPMRKVPSGPAPAGVVSGAGAPSVDQLDLDDSMLDDPLGAQQGGRPGVAANGDLSHNNFPRIEEEQHSSTRDRGRPGAAIEDAEDVPPYLLPPVLLLCPNMRPHVLSYAGEPAPLQMAPLTLDV